MYYPDPPGFESKAFPLEKEGFFGFVSGNRGQVVVRGWFSINNVYSLLCVLVFFTVSAISELKLGVYFHTSRFPGIRFRLF
ncbi:unnamed protein product, partial [Leptidea sinapis]